MKKEDLLIQMDELLELPKGTLTGSEALSDLEQWDSLAVLSFIAMADEHWGVTVAPKQIVACKSVNDLLLLANPQVSA